MLIKETVNYSESFIFVATSSSTFFRLHKLFGADNKVILFHE